MLPSTPLKRCVFLKHNTTVDCKVATPLKRCVVQVGLGHWHIHKSQAFQPLPMVISCGQNRKNFPGLDWIYPEGKSGQFKGKIRLAHWVIWVIAPKDETISLHDRLQLKRQIHRWMSTRQWPKGSDFVARFCTLCESKNLRPCKNRVWIACDSRMAVGFLTCAPFSHCHRFFGLEQCAKVWHKSYTYGHCLMSTG